MPLRIKRKNSVEGRSSALVEQHFVLQDDRPAHVRRVEIEALDPFLRGLLFTDGTVTRALGVQLLAPVAVKRISQAPAPMTATTAAYLEASPEEELIRRRVGIGVGAPPTPALWAESHMIPERLPPGFMGLLDGAPDGIGQSLQRLSLESSRELCWHGLDSVPEWAPESVGARESLRREYRIVSAGRPAILISEYFAVEQRDGVYRLAGLAVREPMATDQKGS